jgi:hypothetical protein
MDIRWAEHVPHMEDMIKFYSEYMNIAIKFILKTYSVKCRSALL